MCTCVGTCTFTSAYVYSGFTVFVCDLSTCSYVRYIVCPHSSASSFSAIRSGIKFDTAVSPVNLSQQRAERIQSEKAAVSGMSLLVCFALVH